MIAVVVYLAGVIGSFIGCMLVSKYTKYRCSFNVAYWVAIFWPVMPLVLLVAWLEYVYEKVTRDV